MTKPHKTSLKNSLIEELTVFLSLSEPERIFAESVRFITEHFNCQACYIMTLCENKDTLELQSVLDLKQLIKFNGSAYNTFRTIEEKAIRKKNTFFTPNLLESDYYGNFLSIKNNLAILCEPLVYEEKPIATISLLFENLKKIPVKTTNNIKFVCKYIAVAVSEALKSRALKGELTLQKISCKILKSSYSEPQESLKQFEIYIASELGASKCLIESSGNLKQLNAKNICSKTMMTQCIAANLCNTIKLSNETEVCPYRIKNKLENKLSYCIPFKMDIGKTGILFLEFPAKKTIKTSEEFIFEQIAESISIFLKNVKKEQNNADILTIMSMFTEFYFELSKPQNSDAVLDKLSAVISKIFKADIVRILMLSDNLKELETVFYRLSDGTRVSAKPISAFAGISGYVIKNKIPYATQDLINDILFAGTDEERMNIKSFLAFPLFLNNQVVGVVHVMSEDSYHIFDLSDKTTNLNISILSSKLAFFLERTKLIKNIENYMQRLQKYAEDLEFANNCIQSVNRQIATSYEFSKILSSATDVEHISTEILQKLSAILLKKPAFLLLTLLEEHQETVDIIILETKQRNKIQKIKTNVKKSTLMEKTQGQEQKISKLNNEDILFLSHKGWLPEKTKTAYTLPIYFQDKQVIAVFMLGFEEVTEISNQDEKLLTSLSYQMAIPIRNGILNKANVIDKNKLKAIINSIADGLITINLNRKITAYNLTAKEMLEFDEKNIVDISYEDIIQNSASQPEDIWKDLQTCGNKGYISREFSKIDSTGKTRFFDSAISPITYNGINLGAVFVIRDVTEKKLWEQMKNDFIAIVAHDLRTPLTIIKSCISILMDHGKKLNEEEQRESYIIINSEMDRFTRLLNNFTNLGNMELGNLQSFPVEFHINELLEKVSHLHSLNTKKHNILLDLPPNKLVYADKDQIEQVINNLLSNAIKYSPDGGTVKIKLSEPKGSEKLKISITDNGIGVSKIDQITLFDKYLRVKNNNTKYIGGTGLGLYICKILMESNRGNIGIDSSEGNGSTFYIEIPKNNKTDILQPVEN